MSECRPCSSLICVAPSDFDFSLQGLAAVALPPVEPIPTYGNDAVLYCCPTMPPTIVGTLPSWISLVGACLRGAADTFSNPDKATATATAQAALDAYVETALESGDITCGPGTFENEAVYWTCDGGEAIEFTGVLPAWITFDEDNNRLVGAAGNYNGDTQQEANDAAQLALDLYASEQITADNLNCDSASTATCNEVGQPDRVRIKDYTDGIVVACINGTDDDIAWPGTFPDHISTCYWVTDNGTPYYSIPGAATGRVELGGAQVKFNQNAGDWLYPGVWSLIILGIGGDVWIGTRNVGDGPIGIYTKVGGCNAGPPTLEIEAY